MIPQRLLSNRYAASLEVSWKEGVASAVMLATLEYYLVPLGLFLKALPYQIGILASLPYLAGSISQIFAVSVSQRVGSRRKILVFGASAQALLLGCVAVLPLWGTGVALTLLIILIVAFRILSDLVGTIWGTLVSDYLSIQQRGLYFGWRARVTGLAGIFAVISAGLFLTYAQNRSAAWGFFVLFAAVSLARCVSVYFMARMQDVPLLHRREDHFTLSSFLRRFRESNFVKFVLFVVSITFATHLAAPFFSVYMLQDLGMSYLRYMLVHLAAVVAGIISFPIWGRHADEIGNAKILKLTSFLVPLIPVLWVFSTNILWLILIELFAGFVWGGFNLCAVNFIFDAVTSEKRVRCLSYFNLLNGLAIFAGAAIGGLLYSHLPAWFGSRYYTLFLLSGLLRFMSHFFLSRHFAEVRVGIRAITSAALFFSAVGIRPVLGTNRRI